ncbi:MAG: DnaA regulatory inactivator Hda [Pseudomonadota bacterium]
MTAVSPQLPLDVRLDVEARFDTFFVGPNEAAFAALTHLAAPGVWLAGPPQSGRSHLLQAVATESEERPAIFLPLDQSLPPESIDGFPGGMTICLDNIDAVIGNGEWERALLLLWEQLIKSEGRLVVSAGGVVSDLPFALDDLKSRMSALPSYQLRLPDDGGQLAALKRRAESRGLRLSDDAAAYMLRRLPRSLAVLFEWLSVLDQHALGASRQLTLPFVRDIVTASAGDIDAARAQATGHSD